MVATGDANDDFAVGDARGHGDRVVILRIGYARLPDHLAGEGIQSFEPSIDDGGEDHSVIDCHATVDDPATDPGADRLLIHLRVPTPEFFAGASIQGENDAPVGDAEDGVVPDQRGPFLITAAVAQAIGPREAEPFDVRSIDLVQGTEARLAQGAPIGQPVALEHVLGRAGVLQHLRIHVDARGWLLRANRRDAGGRKDGEYGKSTCNDPVVF